MTNQYFSRNYRVYMENTDSSGVMYHANYIAFCERARSDFGIEALHFTEETLKELNLIYVVKKLNANFIQSVKFGQELSVNCIPYKINGAGIYFYQTISQQDGTVAYAQVTLVVFVDKKTNLPTFIPDSFAQIAKKYIVDPDNLKMRVKF